MNQSYQQIEIFINSFESMCSTGVNEYMLSNRILNILNSKHSLVDEIVKIDINQEMVGAEWFAKTGDKSDH
jgi:hypothetical protein